MQSSSLVRRFLPIALLTAAWLALPALVLFRTGELHPRWWLASLAPTFLVLGLGPRGGVAVTALKVVFACLLGVTSLLYSISIDTQGTGFNQQFFFHLDGPTASIMFREFPAAAWTLLAILAGQVFLTAAVRGHRRARPRVLVAIAGVLVLVSPPVTSLVAHAVASARMGSGSEELTELVRERGTQTPRSSGAGRPRNIVLIYMEGFESLFLDPELFGHDLAPELRELMAEGKNFVDMRKAIGTGFTMAGIFSSQCGLPLRSRVHGNQLLSSIDPELTGGGCLAQLLSEAGYHTVYMGGANGDFGGKSEFLRGSGFSEVLGREELEGRVDPDYLSGWGLYDDTLFDLAREELDDLYAEGRPFLLSMLTLDTHPPTGYVSRSCDPPEELSGSIRAAIHCTSKLVTEFVRDVFDRDPDDTLVVLMSDHLSMRVDVTPLLKEKAQDRRLTFALLAPWIEPERIDKPGTHFDVAPTLLEAAGFEGFGDFPMGQSLLSHPQGFVHQEGITREELATFDLLDLLMDDRAIPGRIVLDGPNERVRLAGQWIEMTRRGLEATTFLVRIDSSGAIAFFGIPEAGEDWLLDRGDYLVVFERDPARLADRPELADLELARAEGPVFLVGRPAGGMQSFDAAELVELEIDAPDQ